MLNKAVQYVINRSKAIAQRKHLSALTRLLCICFESKHLSIQAHTHHQYLPLHCLIALFECVKEALFTSAPAPVILPAGLNRGISYRRHLLIKRRETISDTRSHKTHRATIQRPCGDCFTIKTCQTHARLQSAPDAV